MCGNSKPNKSVINGSCDDCTITNLFEDHFQKACGNNSNDFNDRATLDFDYNRWSSYCGSKRKLDKDILNAEIVGLAVSSLKANKAAGIDGLIAKHLTYCHPIIHVTLARLFHFILLCQKTLVRRMIVNISGVSLLVP